ncbi:histidine kinase [Halorubrum sp. SD690R]|uniref:ATP-binding protein n=1 Tax=Halorubrum sp. SD690R TaxID=2518117 RepID=UPI0010F7D9C4|nr:ATP-binding protein [Halorubrum sp. SD690R]TKX47826.1 histidine kinase [Halorubrum sp. SD690R]
MNDTPGASAPDADLRVVLDRMADGFFALDADWRITYTNETGAAILREAMADDIVESRESVEGANIWESIPEAVETEFYDRYHEAMETQEPVSFDSYYEPLDTWFDVRVSPSESGLSIHLRDITEQRELERQRERDLKAVQRLYAVSSDRKRPFEEKLDSLFELGCEYLDVPNGFLTRIDDGTQYIEASHATHEALQPGESCPLAEAYCKQTIGQEDLLTVVDAAAEGWSDDPAFDRFNLGTYVGGRVEVDAELYGTLCFADTAARSEPFTDLQQTFVRLLTRWVSYELERKRAEAEVQRERDRHEEFTSVVTHDLRNPLNAAIGHVDLVDADGDDHLQAVKDSLSRMETLIDDLLTLAREDTQVEDLTAVDVADLSREAWGTAETRGADLTATDDRVVVRADRSKLRQLLENLFRNAVDHGGTDVTIRVAPLADASGFFVEDDGPGIPASEREKVFESGFTTSKDGTGLGLRIVEEIAAAHGWTVTVGEGSEGGARFEIEGVQFVDD